jgi:branched-chain amino acid transport system permease protein
MKPAIRTALRTGLSFGVVLVFFILIGFAFTFTELIADLVGSPRKPLPLVVGLVVFLALMGLWAGVSGSKHSENRRSALVAGLIAGAASGLAAGALIFVIGMVHTSSPDANIRRYLNTLSPEAIEALLFSLAQPILAGVLYVGALGIAGMLGGQLGYWNRHRTHRRTIGGLWASATQPIRQRYDALVERTPLARYAAYGLLAVALFLVPQFLSRYWTFTLGTVGIYVLLGLGLNIVVGLAGLLDLGYVAFFAVGAYTVALLTAPIPHNLLWDFWVTVPLALALAALAGALLGVPVLRLRGDYLAIVTLGFGEIIRLLVKSDALEDFFNAANGIPNVGEPYIFGSPFNSEREFLYLITLSIALVIFITTRLQNSRIGRAWVAIREDETVAQAMGINTLKYKLLAFATGAAFAGLGGLLFASRNQFTSPDDLTLMVSINVLAVVIVGGMGSIPGIILGAFVLKGLPEILRELESFRIVAFGALLVIMMIIRPEGLWPSQRRRLEMHEVEAPLEDEAAMGGEAA